MAKKHVPVRTCVVCGESYPKREMVRIVRTPEGEVVIDPRGKIPGRGAYLCTKPSCWDLRVAVPKLQRALRVHLPEETREALAAYAKTLHSQKPETAGETP